MNTVAGSRMERKRKDTQNKIIDAAIELFNQNGLNFVTMEQIAESADIAKGTLYNYFPSKDAIINAYLQRTFQVRNVDRLKKLHQLPDTRSRMVLLFGLLVEGIQAQKDVFEAFLVYRMKQVISLQPVEGERSGLYVLVHELIVLGQQNGELRADLPEDLLEGLFEFALIEAVKPFYLDPEGFNASQSIERCVDIFINGAKA